MTNAERWTAVLEVQMLELFAEALEDVRPAVLKRLQRGLSSHDGRAQIQQAFGVIAAEAASHFERVVASQAGAETAKAEAPVPHVAERRLAS
jgi:hypothetical protein